MRLILVFLLSIIPIFAEVPVPTTRWVTMGFESATAQEAVFTVIVSYKVPGVVDDSDTHHFKRSWLKVQETAHADA